MNISYHKVAGYYISHRTAQHIGQHSTYFLNLCIKYNPVKSGTALQKTDIFSGSENFFIT